MFNELSAYGVECGMQQMSLSETHNLVPFFDAKSHLIFFTVNAKNIDKKKFMKLICNAEDVVLKQTARFQPTDKFVDAILIGFSGNKNINTYEDFADGAFATRAPKPNHIWL